MDIEDFGDVDVRLWRLGAPGSQVGIQHMRIGSPSVATRGTCMLQDGNDDVILHLQLSGQRVLRQLGREADAPANAAVFSWNAEPSTIVLPEATAFVSIALPYRALRALDPRIETHLVRTVPPDEAVLGLLRRYLGLIEGETSQTDGAVSHLMGQHILELCGHLVGAGKDTERQTGALRAARLHALKDDVRRNLSGDVSARALAARHRVTPRYIHKLFESEGLSVSQYVLGLRLEAVRRMLCDPISSGRTIAEIVFAVGFGDVSTFNRAYRARFGETPGDTRWQQRAKD